MTNEASVVVRPAIRAFYGRIFFLLLLAAGGLMAPNGVAWLAEQDHQQLRDLAAASFDLPGLGETGLATIGMMIGFIGAAVMALSITYSRYYYTWTFHPGYMHASIGLVANKERSLYYENARIPTIRRGIMDRILMVGDLEVSSTGGGDEGEFHMQHVSNPKRLKQVVMNRIEASRGK